MRYHERMRRSLRGMSFIDVIVGSALMLTVFLALFGLVRASLLVSAVAKAEAGATAVATSQLEYLRSLDYDAIGTVGGIPAGVVAQNATTTLNNIAYAVRTAITYRDDPADGEGASDLIPTDYKRVRVTVSYTLGDREREVSLVSSYAPPGLETDAPGGILRLEIVDADGLPVPGAEARVVNAGASPAVDATYFSDAFGVVLLPGTPPATDYAITIEKSGYSSAQTYARDATNVNPSPGHLTVADSQTTTSAFAIDELAELIVRTFAPPASGSFTDPFDGATLLDSLSDTQVFGGTLILAGTPGTYAESGEAASVTITPTSFTGWDNADATVDVPVGTSFLLRVLDNAGVPISDTDLPGNAAGFSAFPISLSGLATSTYPSLALAAELESEDPGLSPSIESWTLSYDTPKSPLPDVPFTLTGTKTIGADGSGVSIIKTEITTATDETGEIVLPLEWDFYTLTVGGGYTVIEEVPLPPYTLSPGAELEVDLTLTP